MNGTVDTGSTLDDLFANLNAKALGEADRSSLVPVPHDNDSPSKRKESVKQDDVSNQKSSLKEDIPVTEDKPVKQKESSRQSFAADKELPVARSRSLIRSISGFPFERHPSEKEEPSEKIETADDVPISKQTDPFVNVSKPAREETVINAKPFDGVGISGKDDIVEKKNVIKKADSVKQEDSVNNEGIVENAVISKEGGHCLGEVDNGDISSEESDIISFDSGLAAANDKVAEKMISRFRKWHHKPDKGYLDLANKVYHRYMDVVDTRIAQIRADYSTQTEEIRNNTSEDVQLMKLKGDDDTRQRLQDARDEMLKRLDEEESEKKAYILFIESYEAIKRQRYEDAAIIFVNAYEVLYKDHMGVNLGQAAYQSRGYLELTMTLDWIGQKDWADYYRSKAKGVAVPTREKEV